MTEPLTEILYSVIKEQKQPVTMRVLWDDKRVTKYESFDILHALDDLVKARFIKKEGERPACYSIQDRPQPLPTVSGIKKE